MAVVVDYQPARQRHKGLRVIDAAGHADGGFGNTKRHGHHDRGKGADIS